MATLVSAWLSRGPFLALRLLVFFLARSLTLAQSTTRDPANVLIYSATMGYRHDSIPTAVEALISRSATYNITFNHFEDPDSFTEGSLEKYDAIIFLSTTGEVLDSDGKTAFQNYLNRGGNFVGIHSASDSLKNTLFYEQEIGAYLDHYSPVTNLTIDVLSKDHPSTSVLPENWGVTDEIYYFQSDPRSVGAIVILSIDKPTLSDPVSRQLGQVQSPPVAWYQEKGAGTQSGGIPGRSFYTSLGHLNATWQNELFMSHVFGGITWVLNSGTTKASNHTTIPDQLYHTDTGTRVSNNSTDYTSIGKVFGESDSVSSTTTTSSASASSTKETKVEKILDIMWDVLPFLWWIPLGIVLFVGGFIYALCATSIRCVYQRFHVWRQQRARTPWVEPEMASSTV